MAPTTRVGPRVGFVAGLMDWVGDEMPTAEDLAGRPALDQGHAHIKTIVHTGGQILGCLELDEDAILADPDPDSTWGFKFIERLAERRFTAR